MSQPTLRCPQCGQSVNMPAEACPCGYNFRSGQNPQKVQRDDLELTAASSKLHFFLGGAIVLALLILLAIFFLRSPSSPTPAGTAGGGAPLGPPPSLKDSPLLNPHVPIGQAQDVAAKANANAQRLKDTQAEVEAERGQ
ncbi:MAG: hypothetical protein LBS60_05545 [Deltaproteobacteria bacterium]|jgi:hypothetical protein|nr:hypothetical protein [Deltaproteobacteria bacterium]